MARTPFQRCPSNASRRRDTLVVRPRSAMRPPRDQVFFGRIVVPARRRPYPMGTVGVMTTISFCICTRGAAARARALLELVRPVVDEIVVGVDDSDDHGTMEACADLADRRLSFASTGVPCRPIGWILRQCSGDWILRLDDDEVPSARLLEELPALT